MTQASEIDFQDDFRKVGHDATAAFERAGSPSNPTEYASSERLEMRSVDDDLVEDDEDANDEEDEFEDEDDDLDDEDEDEDDEEEDEGELNDPTLTTRLP